MGNGKWFERWFEMATHGLKGIRNLILFGFRVI